MSDEGGGLNVAMIQSMREHAEHGSGDDENLLHIVAMIHPALSKEIVGHQSALGNVEGLMQASLVGSMGDSLAGSFKIASESKTSLIGVPTKFFSKFLEALGGGGGGDEQHGSPDAGEALQHGEAEDGHHPLLEGASDSHPYPEADQAIGQHGGHHLSEDVQSHSDAPEIFSGASNSKIPLFSSPGGHHHDDERGM